MKIKYNSTKAIQFQYSQDLPKWSDAGVPIHIVEMPDGKLRVMIEISTSGSFTEEAQRNAVPLARNWLRRLEEIQGQVLSESQQQINELRDKWSNLQANKLGWKELAADINEKVISRLKWIASFRDSLPDDIPSRFPGVVFSIYDMLWAAGLKDKEADEIYRAGIENIERGLPAFDSVYPPIDWRKLKQIIEYHRKKYLKATSTRQRKT